MRLPRVPWRRRPPLPDPKPSVAERQARTLADRVMAETNRLRRLTDELNSYVRSEAQ